MSPLSGHRKNWSWGLLLRALLFAALCFGVSCSVQALSRSDDRALFAEAEDLFTKGEIEKALWRFRRITVDFPASALYDEARFRMALCYTRLKRPKDALRILTDLLSTSLAPPRKVEILTLMGDNYLELKDQDSALLWYGKAILSANPPAEELKKKVRSLVDRITTEKELNQIASSYRGAYAGGYAKWRLLLMARSRRDETAVQKFFQELEKEYRTMDYYSEAKRLLEPSMKPKYTIGVILPLSGPYQPFGERALKAIEFAIRQRDSRPAASAIALAIRDSKGLSQEAEKAVEDLVIREKAIALLGPLLSATVEKAAKKAQQLRTPMLTLSQKEVTGGRNDFIFQNSLTPLAQVRTLAHYAIKELELRTFAVISPNSPYGHQYKNLFTQEVSARGGRVVGALVYQEDQTDFGAEIRRFFKVEILTRYDSKNRKIEEFKPTFSVGGLFIPDSYERVALILSQLDYYEVKEPVFLGTNAWNHPQLLSAAGRAAEGAVFVDAFFKGSRSPEVTRFVDEFRKLYQHDPETLEALAYDGMRFLVEVLSSKSFSTAVQVRDEMRRFNQFKGVSNLRGFGEGGYPIRPLAILRIKQGRIEQINP